MAKQTLLDITQDILSDMESDEVNSITDTVESLQVAQIIKSTYYNIVDGLEWPWLKSLYTLTGLGDVTKPSHVQIPELVIEVLWVKYNKRTSTDTFDRFSTVTYKTPSEFTALCEQRLSDAPTVTVVTDPSGLSLNILNNTAPTYYTSFDDNYIVFDSFDSAVDSTLQTSKTQCFGKRHPAFTLSDTFTPDLPVQMFTYLLNEAKATCFSTLKQTINTKAEQHSVSQRRRMSQQAWKISKGIKYPNYGRK